VTLPVKKEPCHQNEPNNEACGDLWNGGVKLSVRLVRRMIMSDKFSGHESAFLEMARNAGLAV
jgi:hypothetical protein